MAWWGRGRGGQGAAEQQIQDLTERAGALLVSDPQQAADLLAEAIGRVRLLHEQAPDDREHIRALGSIGYQLGAALTSAERHREAADALADAEAAYRKLPSRAEHLGWIADVRARRAVALAMLGSGASAVCEAQAAVELRRTVMSKDGDLDLARVLSMAADVQAVHGDPDLAVAAADHAIRTYIGKSKKINSSGTSPLHAPYMARACAVAVAVHGAAGRFAPAGAARDMLGTLIRRGSAADLPTVLAAGTRAGRPPDPKSTLAAALRRAGAGADLRAAVTRPAMDVELLVPADRADVRLAHVRAQQLAELAIGVRGRDGLRIGTEAHFLFAAASEAETPSLRYGFGEVGPAWGRVLLHCAALAEAADDLTLALDLASWAAGVAQRLMPFALGDADTREVAVECVEAHATLLRRTGDPEAAAGAFAAAARLRDLGGNTD